MYQALNSPCFQAATTGNTQTCHCSRTAWEKNGPFSRVSNAKNTYFLDELPKNPSNSVYEQRDISLSLQQTHPLMDIFLSILAVSLLLLAAASSWALTLLGLPGNWLMVLSAALYAWLGPETGVLQIGWPLVLAIAALAAAGELAELAASVWGAKRAGGSRRAAVFALLGSLAGAVAGAFFGLPLPVVGSPLAALLGGALGALAGAAAAEHSLGETPGQSLRVGHAAFWGRVLGTGAKTLAGVAIAATLLIGIIL